ncbi:MAG: response regulator [Eubacteriales bacterium]|nr:response regulator [Eubacteriales bacterium]
MYQALFVDDDRFLVQNMSRILDWQEYGFEKPLTACSVIEAMQILKEQKIDLLITDIEMPGKTGFDLTDYVLDNYPDITCCLLTGYARFDYAHKAVKLHAFDYLLKPLQKDDLAALLLKFRSQFEKTKHPQEKYSQLVEQTIAYVRENLKEPISRETITNVLHVSEGHISHLFKKETGVSLPEYITDMRVEKAKALLADSNASVAEICEQIGYNYQAYFTKIFKEKTGVPPLQYRKDHRKR